MEILTGRIVQDPWCINTESAKTNIKRDAKMSAIPPYRIYSNTNLHNVPLSWVCEIVFGLADCSLSYKHSMVLALKEGPY